MSDAEHAPISELSLSDLRTEYKNLTEAWVSGRLSEAERERRADMWAALLNRTDVEQPLRAEIQAAWNRILGDGGDSQ